MKRSVKVVAGSTLRRQVSHLVAEEHFRLGVGWLLCGSASLRLCGEVVISI